MRVIVFGATGKTGRHVCRELVERGHGVTAFARSPERLEGVAGVEVVQGDVMDASAVEEAVAGHDGVIVVLGSAGLRDQRTLTEGTRNVVDGMSAQGVKRVVVLSAAGVGESWGQIPMMSRIMFRTLLRNIYADHTAQEAVVRESGLDWTIVRAGVLNDEPGGAELRIGNEGRIGSVSRRDVAYVLVGQLGDEGAVGRVVSVGT